MKVSNVLHSLWAIQCQNMQTYKNNGSSYTINQSPGLVSISLMDGPKILFQ